MSFDGRFTGNKAKIVNSPAEVGGFTVEIDKEAYGRQLLQDDEARPVYSELDSPHKVDDSK